MNLNKKNTTIELFREDMKFSSANFTIFSGEKREKLHGHNFHVHIAITSEVNENGLEFDYTICRKEIISLCKQLNEYCLIPSQSKYLAIKKYKSSYSIIFNNKKFIFPKNDVLLLPLENITTKTLSTWFSDEIWNNKSVYSIDNAVELSVKISPSPGQYASSIRALEVKS